MEVLFYIIDLFLLIFFGNRVPINLIVFRSRHPPDFMETKFCFLTPIIFLERTPLCALQMVSSVIIIIMNRMGKCITIMLL